MNTDRQIIDLWLKKRIEYEHQAGINIMWQALILPLAGFDGGGSKIKHILLIDADQD